MSILGQWFSFHRKKVVVKSFYRKNDYEKGGHFHEQITVWGSVLL